MQQKFQVEIFWHFTQKKVIGGVGEKAKSTIQTIISTNNSNDDDDNSPIILTAEDFADIIKEHIKSIKV